MLKVLHGGSIIDGYDRLSITDPEVHVLDGKITYVGSSAEAPPESKIPEVEHHHLGSATLMPGMIDCHAHPIPSPFVSDIWSSFVGEDELRVLRATQALKESLLSGITTFRDCGSPRNTGFALKKAVGMGIVPGPRLVISGPAITATGGHMRMHGGEVDGPDNVRQQVRLFFKKGIDFVKVAASGGSTPGTVRHHGSYTVEELQAAVEEATQHDSYVTAHVHATEGMRRCVDAGVQMLEHATFVGLDGEVHLDRDLALRIRDQNVIVDPTVCVHGRWLEQVAERVPQMDAEEYALWSHRSEGFKRRLDLVAALHAEGIPLLIGSDATSAIRSYPAPLDDLAYNLALHVGVGISPIEVIRSTTSLAADAIGLGAVTGRLEVGKEADIIAVEGDPTKDIAAMEKVSFVMARGVIAKGPTAN